MDKKNSFLKLVLLLDVSLGCTVSGCNTEVKKATKEMKTGTSHDGFAMKRRLIILFTEPDGYSHFSTAENSFTWADMIDIKPDSAWGQFVADARQYGYNYLMVTFDPEDNPAAMRRFARFLKANDIGLICVRLWNESEIGYSWPFTSGVDYDSPKLCPYTDEARQYWKNRIARDYEMMPDLAGYMFGGSESYTVKGAPWQGQCPDEYQDKTPQEMVVAAIRLLAELLEPYGGTLFWEVHQDDPWSCQFETDYFRDITVDQIPENAVVSVQHIYWDFHPTWPRHPLMETLKTDGKFGARYASSIQLCGEYRGVHNFPWCMVDRWSETLRYLAATGQQGVVVYVHGMNTDVTRPNHQWDHPLNMVNWYALERFMRDPYADPAKIKLTWATQEFGEKAAPVVVEILNKMTQAAERMLKFDSLWTHNHSQLPDLTYLDSHLCGPYRRTPREIGLLGMAFPLHMYAPQRAAEIKADPKTRLVFNQVPITPQLKTEAIAQKNEATSLVEECIELWKSLRRQIEQEKHRRILAGLRGNRNDTIVFRHMMEMYMDWKLGELNEANIDAALQACQGLRGVIVMDPLDPDPPRRGHFEKLTTLKTFAEQLRRELREPWIEKFWEDNPVGVAVLIEDEDKEDPSHGTEDEEKKN